MSQLPARNQQAHNDITQFVNQDRFLDENRKITLKNTNDAEFLDFFFHMELLQNNEKDEPLSDHTIRAYKSDGKVFLQFLQTHQLSVRKIGEPEVRQYNKYIRETYANRTAIRRLDFFKRLLRFGFEYDFFPIDFSGKVKKPKSIKGHKSSKEVTDQRLGKKVAGRRELKDDDAKEVVHYFEELVEDNPRNRMYMDFLKTRNQLIGWLLLRTGARARELLSLTFGSFTKENDGVYMQVLGKGNKNRNIPILSPTLLEILEKHKLHVKEKYDLTDRELKKIPVLFTPIAVKHASQIRPMSYNNLYKLVKKAVTLAEQNPDVSPHWFRHTFITFLLSENVPLATVKEIAGHSNIATTNIYLEEIDKKKMHRQLSHIDFD